MRANQHVLFTFICIGALTLLGCSKPDVAPTPTAEQAGEGPGPVEEPKAAAQASSPVAQALKAANEAGDEAAAPGPLAAGGGDTPEPAKKDAKAAPKKDA